MKSTRKLTARAASRCSESSSLTKGKRRELAWGEGVPLSVRLAGTSSWYLVHQRDFLAWLRERSLPNRVCGAPRARGVQGAPRRRGGRFARSEHHGERAARASAGEARRTTRRPRGLAFRAPTPPREHRRARARARARAPDPRRARRRPHRPRRFTSTAPIATRHVVAAFFSKAASRLKT